MKRLTVTHDAGKKEGDAQRRSGPRVPHVQTK